MLWVCPYVTPDSKAYREAVQKGFLLQNESGGSFVAEWWNGFSVAVDLSTHPACSWLDTQLEALRGLGWMGSSLTAETRPIMWVHTVEGKL